MLPFPANRSQSSAIQAESSPCTKVQISIHCYFLPHAHSLMHGPISPAKTRFDDI